MLMVVDKGFTIDTTKTSISHDNVYFNGGQIYDPLLNLIYVRKGFTIPKVTGLIYVYFDPILDIPILKNIADNNPKEVYLGLINISGSAISMTLPDGTQITPIDFVASDAGVVHSEDVLVDEYGYITLSKTPNVIIEVYVEGYGFMNISDGVDIEGLKINLGTTELVGYSVRVVYES